MTMLDKFIEENCKNESEKEIVYFGIERIKVFTIGLLAVIITGILLHEIGRTIFLVICLLPLRQNAGGYHMRNKRICAVCSYAILVASILCMKYVSIDANASLAILLICTVLISCFAPIGNINRRLDRMERKVYGRRARIICYMEGILFLIFFRNNLSECYMIIMLSEQITCILLLIGKIQELILEGSDT